MNLLDRKTVFDHYNITLNHELAPKDYPEELAKRVSGPSYEDIWCSNDEDNIADSIIASLKQRYPNESNVAYCSFVSVITEYFLKWGISYGTDMYEAFYAKEHAAQKLLLDSLVEQPVAELEEGMLLVSKKLVNRLYQETLNAEETMKRIKLLEHFYFEQ